MVRGVRTRVTLAAVVNPDEVNSLVGVIAHEQSHRPFRGSAGERRFVPTRPQSEPSILLGGVARRQGWVLPILRRDALLPPHHERAETREHRKHGVREEHNEEGDRHRAGWGAESYSG